MGDREKPHRCTFEGCNAAFHRRDRWTQHLLTHENIKAFKCCEDNCSKAYTSKSHLERHINTAHRNYQDKDAVYGCTTCSKVYANRQNLKRHLKTHLKPSLYCDTCNLEFPKKHMLSTHMYQHTGIKPFSCNLCTKEFLTLQEKKKHLRNHKNYVCTESGCEMTFNHWSKFQKHLKTDHENREFICDACGRVFKHRLHIVRHVRLHDKVPQVYACPYEECKRSFSRNSNLKQHILMKHERITHECSICEAQLSCKATLKKHLAQHKSGQKVRVPKIKATGRRPRKDCGSVKVTTALKLAGLFQGKPIKSPATLAEVIEINVA